MLSQVNLYIFIYICLLYMSTYNYNKSHIPFLGAKGEVCARLDVLRNLEVTILIIYCIVQSRKTTVSMSQAKRPLVGYGTGPRIYHQPL